MIEFYEALAERGLEMTFCEFSDMVIENGEVLLDHVGGRDNAREERDCK